MFLKKPLFIIIKSLPIVCLMPIFGLTIKKLKYTFFILLVVVFLCGALTALNITYKPTILVKKFLWYFLFPFFVALCFYFGILKKQILIQPYSLKKRLKYGGYTLFLAAIMVFIVCDYLGLVSAYFAQQPISELSTVLRADCHPVVVATLVLI